MDHPDWTFAQIAKWISDEWKKIEADEKDELQKEAEEMNELGIRKLPRDDDGPDPEKDTTDEDSDFEEGYRKKSKPIMLKIKKEKKDKKVDKDSGAVDGSDESDWEPVAEIMPPEREQTRSGRQRKRPSFFQEFESQENNLDSILQEFEETQAKEFGKPRQPKPTTSKPATERKPRKRKVKPEPVVTEDQSVEVETLRSGRKRKVRRVMQNFMDEEDDEDRLGKGASSDDDDFEPPPEEEVEKIEEHDDLIEEDEDEGEFDDEEEEYDENNPTRGDDSLPPKKRGRPKKILTDAEIEEATRAAMAKPAIEITRVPKVGREVNGKQDSLEPGEVPSNDTKNVNNSALGDRSNESEVSAPDTGKDGGEKGLIMAKKSVAPQPDGESFKPMFVNETLEESDGEDAGEKDKNPLDAKNPLGEDNPSNDSVEAAAKMVEETRQTRTETMNEEEALLATATSEQPPFVTECGEDSMENHGANSAILDTENPLGGGDETTAVDDKESRVVNLGGHSFSGGQREDISGPPLSEEDLLTGPAHNLDDSSYKADYVDPNLDDIFK